MTYYAGATHISNFICTGPMDGPRQYKLYLSDCCRCDARLFWNLVHLAIRMLRLVGSSGWRENCILCKLVINNLYISDSSVFKKSFMHFHLNIINHWSSKSDSSISLFCILLCTVNEVVWWRHSWDDILSYREWGLPHPCWRSCGQGIRPWYCFCTGDGFSSIQVTGFYFW